MEIKNVISVRIEYDFLKYYIFTDTQKGEKKYDKILINMRLQNFKYFAI